MVRLITLLAGLALIVLIALMVTANPPWRREPAAERTEYHGAFAADAEPAPVTAPPVVAAAPEPPKAEPGPPPKIDDRVAEDAAAVGMTTVEPDDAPDAAAPPASAPAGSDDEPIT